MEILFELIILYYKVGKNFPPVIGIKYFPHFDLFLDFLGTFSKTQIF